MGWGSVRVIVVMRSTVPVSQRRRQFERVAVQAPPREPGCDLTGEGGQAEQQAIQGDRGAQAQAEAQAERRRRGLEGRGIFTARDGGEQGAEAGAELATEIVVVEPREVQKGTGAIVFQPGDGLGERVRSERWSGRRIGDV